MDRDICIEPLNIHREVEYLIISSEMDEQDALMALMMERGVDEYYGRPQPEVIKYKGPWLLVKGKGLDTYDGEYTIWYMTNDYCEKYTNLPTEAEAMEYMDKEFINWYHRRNKEENPTYVSVLSMG